MRRLVLFLIPISLALAAEPAPAPATKLPPLEAVPANQLPATFDLAQYAFDVRLAMSSGENFGLIEKAYRTHPTPHIAATYARYLLGGKDWGAPDGRQEEAVRLALDALKHGSVRAYSALGAALMDGKVVAQDRVRGFDYFRRGANAGDPVLMADWANRVGIQAPGQGDYWFNRAGFYGQAQGLVWMAQAYEAGTIGGKPNRDKACRYYLQAGLRRVFSARETLKQLADKGDPLGKLYYSRLILELAARGTAFQRVVYEQAAQMSRAG